MTPRKPYTTSELLHIFRLRMAYTPAEISELTGRTKHAVSRVLSIEKKRTGIIYPKLKHGNMKHDKQKAMKLRLMIKSGMKYRMIRESEGLHMSQISRILSADARGELRW